MVAGANRSIDWRKKKLDRLQVFQLGVAGAGVALYCSTVLVHHSGAVQQWCSQRRALPFAPKHCGATPARVRCPLWSCRRFSETRTTVLRSFQKPSVSSQKIINWSFGLFHRFGFGRTGELNK